MLNLISSQLVEAHEQCPRKAFFLMRGSPTPRLHEYEIAIHERAKTRRSKYYATDLQIGSRIPQLPLSPAVISVGDLQATCDAVTHGKETWAATSRIW